MHEIAECGPFKLIVTNGTERYRAETMFTKEPETVEFIRRLPPDAVLWDVGACIGQYAILCAVIHPESRVVAFEPMPYNFLRLQENIALNGLTNVIALPFCVGDRVGTCSLAIPSTAAGATGSQARKGQEASFPSYAVTIDHASSGMGFPYPTHLKIDIDGQEEAVLLGARGVIEAGMVKGLIVEGNRDLTGLLTYYGFHEDESYPHPETFTHGGKTIRKVRNGVWVRG